MVNLLLFILVFYVMYLFARSILATLFIIVGALYGFETHNYLVAAPIVLIGLAIAP